MHNLSMRKMMLLSHVDIGLVNRNIRVLPLTSTSSPVKLIAHVQRVVDQILSESVVEVSFAERNA